MAEVIPDDVRAFRDEYRRTRIGRHYRGEIHAAFTFLGSIAAVVGAVSRVEGASAVAWLTVPVTFVLANLVEYLGHRFVMHKRRRGFALLFERHTLEHHHFFAHDALAYESHRDVKMVLFPPVMLVFFLGGIATPIAVLLFVLASANVAWLFVATAVAYFLAYEVCHFAHHLPETTFPGSLGPLRALRRHHRLHHDRRVMTKKNFNVTIPLADILFATYAREH